MKSFGRRHCRLVYAALFFATFFGLLTLRHARWAASRDARRDRVRISKSRHSSTFSTCETSITLPEEAEEWPSFFDPAAIHPTRNLTWRHPTCTAVLVPFFPSQRRHVKDALDRWEAAPPCRDSKSTATAGTAEEGAARAAAGSAAPPCVDLVLMETQNDAAAASNANASGAAGDASAIWELAAARFGHCFRRVRRMSLSIPARYDTRVDGSTVVFYSLFRVLRGEYGHFLLMEADVVPQVTGRVSLIEALSGYR